MIHVLAFYRLLFSIQNLVWTVENFKAAMSIPVALGLDPTVANSGKTSYFSMITNNILLFFLFKAYWLMMQLY
jgi:hypothetical protein